jgi:3-deoxy-manno-octulosonate cytidylyltransferase (CMP-KDO synthetase)
MITAASVFQPADDLTNPNMVKVVIDRFGDALYFSRSKIPFVRSDGVTPVFYRHQGLYGYTTKFLLEFVRWKPGILEQAESLEQLRALENGAKIRVIKAADAAVSVDTPDDVKAVEAILQASSSAKRTGAKRK